MDKTTKIRIITITAIVFIAVLFVALITNIVRLNRLNARKAELERAISDIERRIDENEAAIDRVSTDDYIDRYAREYLDMQGADDEAFTGKE